MKTITNFFQLKATILFFLFFCSSSAFSVTLFESFDNPSVNSRDYTPKDITYLSSGLWKVCGITKPTTPDENDRINDSYSIRMWGRTAGQTSLYMQFDKVGAGVVSFNYGSYGSQKGGAFVLQMSTNQGSSWTDVGSVVTVSAWSGSFHTYSAVVNYSGNVRFRIEMSPTTDANTKINIDDFQITDYNVDQVAIPVITPAAGVYEATQTVTITSATPNATIYYTLDGSIPTTSSSVYSSATPITVSQTKTVKAMAVLAGMENSRIETRVINIAVPVSTLAGFSTVMPTSGTNLQYYKYTGEAVISYTYTTSTGGRYYFIQDNTAGMIIYDNFKNLTATYTIGDKITGITAQVVNVNDSPQLYPYANFTVVSTGNNLVPNVITLADVSSNLYKLVTFNELFFDEANGTKTFGPNSPYIIHDASTPSTSSIVFRLPSMSTNPDYLTAPNNIIAARKKVTCIISKYSSTVYQIFARSLADFSEPTTGVEELKLIGLSVSGSKVSFETQSALMVRVYTVAGQLLKSFESGVGYNTIELNKGIYLVKVGGSICKVIIK